MDRLKQFQAEVIERIKDQLPIQFAGAAIKANNKIEINGRQLFGLGVIPEDSNIGVTVYLNSFYCKYDGIVADALPEIADLVVEKIKEVPNNDITEEFKSFEAVKDRILLAVVNAATNVKAFAKAGVLSRLTLDLIEYPVIHLDSFGDNTATVKVTRGIANMWGVTEEEIFKTAYANSEAAMFTQSIYNILAMLDPVFASPGQDAVPMVIAMYDGFKVGGAATMLLESTRRQLAAMLDTDSIAIIPSSTTEIIAIPYESIKTGMPLIDMIKQVNASELEPSMVLSDHPYLSVNGSLEILDDEN